MKPFWHWHPGVPPKSHIHKWKLFLMVTLKDGETCWNLYHSDNEFVAEDLPGYFALSQKWKVFHNLGFKE